jgi:hypothetical protein
MKRTQTTILAVLAAAITIFVIRCSNQPILPKETSWDDVLAEARAGGYRLINTAKLWQQYQSGIAFKCFGQFQRNFLQFFGSIKAVNKKFLLASEKPKQRHTGKMSRDAQRPEISEPRGKVWTI